MKHHGRRRTAHHRVRRHRRVRRRGQQLLRAREHDRGRRLGRDRDPDLAPGPHRDRHSHHLTWTAPAAEQRMRSMDETAARGDDVRDDAVTPAIRVTAIVVIAVLVPALIILWGLPTRTDELWAWTIKAPLTPIFMGAGYGAGAYFFLRVYRTSRWHEVYVGVISAAFFALLMLITTILHYDKFNQGKAHDGLPDPPTLATLAFYGWTGVYILSPFVVAFLWWRNQQRDPRTPDPAEPLVPANVRLAT